MEPPSSTKGLASRHGQPRVDQLTWYRTGQYMELDLTARRNLELTETLRGKEKRGSLLWVLDKTKTAMGAFKSCKLGK